MNNNITLSILTPAVPSRIDLCTRLAHKLEKQIGDLPVEHLILLDNKRRKVGGKRDALLRIARGKYISFVDDDDDISEDYVLEILLAAKKDPDVITFRQLSSVNELSAIVEFKLGNPQQQYAGAKYQVTLNDLEFCENDWQSRLPTVRRDAAHLCAWRRTLAIQAAFPDINFGEDFAFSVPLCAAAKSEIHIPKVLHHYRHSTASSEAPPGT